MEADNSNELFQPASSRYKHTDKRIHASLYTYSHIKKPQASASALTGRKHFLLSVTDSKGEKKVEPCQQRNKLITLFLYPLSQVQVFDYMSVLLLWTRLFSIHLTGLSLASYQSSSLDLCYWVYIEGKPTPLPVCLVWKPEQLEPHKQLLSPKVKSLWCFFFCKCHVARKPAETPGSHCSPVKTHSSMFTPN